MKRFKHLKNYKKFNPNNKVNEGLQSVLAIGLGALQLMPGVVKTMQGPQQQQTYFYGQEQQQGGKAGEQKIAVGRTSDNGAWYNDINPENNTKDLQKLLPPGGTHRNMFLVGSMDTLRANLESGNPNPFSGFKWADQQQDSVINAGLKYEKGFGTEKSYLAVNEKTGKRTGAVDFIQIGNRKIEGKGVLTFNWNENGEIIISGNGMLALQRLYSANVLFGGGKKADYNVLSLNSEKVKDANTKFKSYEWYTINTKAQKITMVKMLNYMFEITTEKGNKNTDSEWYKNKFIDEKDAETNKWVKREYGIEVNIDATIKNLIGKSDEEVMNGIEKLCNALNNDFWPRGSDGRVLSKDNVPSFFNNVDFDTMTVDRIKPYLDKYQQTTNQEERDSIFLEFIQENLDIWQNNLNGVIDEFSQNFGITGIPKINEGMKKLYMDAFKTSHYDKFGGSRSFINTKVGQVKPPQEVKLRVPTAGETKGETKIGELPELPGKNENPTIKKESLKYLKRFNRF
jgi:hypothetical protein